MSFGHIQHSLLRAACAGGDQGEVHGHPADGPEQAPAPVPLPELQRRAGIQFSGDSGAVVASGGEGVTSAPTYQLVKDVIEVVADLPPALFDKNLRHRPCGLLDKYGAMGMLLGDVLGLPLMPWALAEPVGKAAAKLPGELSAEIKKARKAAARCGADPRAAAAAVLRRRVKLPLPTAAEIAKKTRQIAKAAQQQAAPPEPPPPEPPPPEPSPPEAAQPAPPQPEALPPQQPDGLPCDQEHCGGGGGCHRCVKCPRLRARLEMLWSEEAERVIMQGFMVLAYTDGGEEYKLELKVVQAHYNLSLRDLRREYPDELVGVMESPDRLYQLGVSLAAVGIYVPAVFRAAQHFGVDTYREEVREEKKRLEALRAARRA